MGDDSWCDTQTKSKEISPHPKQKEKRVGDIGK